MIEYHRRETVEADQIASIDAFNVIGKSGERYVVDDDFFVGRPKVGDYLVDDFDGNRYRWIQRATFEASWMVPAGAKPE